MPAITYTLALATRPRSDGTHQLTLFVRRGRGNQKQFPVVLRNRRVYLTPDQWRRINQKHRNADKDRWQPRLTAYRDKVNEIIETLDVFTWRAFKSALHGTLADRVDLLHWLSRMSNKVEARSTREKYEQTVARVRMFCDCKELPLADVTPAWLDDYQDYFLSTYASPRTGDPLSLATVNMDLRNIRAAWNLAIREKAVKRDRYPFSDGGFSIRKAKPKDSYIMRRDVARLEAMDLEPRSVEAWARDMWVLTFYSSGSNLADVLRWTWDQVDGDFLTYQRHKTRNTSGKTVTLYLLPEIQAIVDRWGTRGGKYIFPDLKGTRTESERDIKVKNANKQINKYMARICERLDLPAMTLYWARRSYAVAMQDSGADIRATRDSMGHTSVTTTEGYIGAARREHIRQAAELLRRDEDAGRRASDG